METIEKRIRDPYWDVLKCVAILMVVFGHMQGSSCMEWGQPFVRNFIVGVNMPLFFAISGYFCAGLMSRHKWSELIRRICGYFAPFIVCCLLFTTLEIIFHLTGAEIGFIGILGRKLLFDGWFVWNLSLQMLLVFACILRRGDRGVIVQLLAISLLYMALLFIPKGIWHFGYLRSMIPFFVFGLFVLRRWSVWKLNMVGAPCLILFIIAVCFEGEAFVDNMSFYRVDSSWWGLTADASGFLWLGVRLIVGTLGIVGIMWFMSAALDILPKLKVLAPFGETTLGVYLTHQWLLARIKEQNWLSSSLIAVTIWTVLLFMFTHCITLLARYIRRRALVIMRERK